MKLRIMIVLLLCCLAGLAAQEQRVPWRAVAYSAVCPGGGQIYNHAYLKAGLVIGVQSFLIGSAIYNHVQEADYAELALQTSDSNLALQYQAQSDLYHDRVNNNIWWMGITAGLSMIDAWVDANLYDFDAQKEKLRVRFSGTEVSLEYRF